MNFVPFLLRRRLERSQQYLWYYLLNTRYIFTAYQSGELFIFSDNTNVFLSSGGAKVIVLILVLLVTNNMSREIYILNLHLSSFSQTYLQEQNLHTWLLFSRAWNFIQSLCSIYDIHSSRCNGENFGVLWKTWSNFAKWLPSSVEILKMPKVAGSSQYIVVWLQRLLSRMHLPSY